MLPLENQAQIHAPRWQSTHKLTNSQSQNLVSSYQQFKYYVWTLDNDININITENHENQPIFTLEKLRPVTSNELWFLFSQQRW